MKKTFVVKLAVAALLALGSITQAQEETAEIPAVDSPTPEVVDNSQSSVSDNVVVEGEVAPVAPIQESIVYDSIQSSGSDCLGCGQASDCLGCGQSTPMVSAPYVSAPISFASGCNGCSSCGGCSPCGQSTEFAQASYVQPATYGCSQGCDQGCGQIGQVAYDQPLYQAPNISSIPASLVSTPTSIVSGPIVNPAPVPVVQVANSGCNSCGGTVAYAAPTNACDTCQPRGRLFRGRLFRNR